MNSKPIQLILISGFMGAGKTTFLQNILDDYRNTRTGVIVNEFGPVSVDGKILNKDGVEIVEINNGSIFCACLKSGFINTLIAFSDQPIDTLIIENSGLGDPSNFLKLLDEIKPYTKKQYQFRGAVCLVDSQYFLDYLDIFTPVQNQIAASNLVLINKTDLADQAELAEIHETIKKINPQAAVFESTYGKLPFAVLNKYLLANDFIGETSNHDWNRPANYFLKSDDEVSKQGLASFLEKISSKVLRLKGFLSSSDGYWHIDMVSDHFQIDHTLRSDINQPGIVIIGKDAADFKDFLINAWENEFGSPPQITTH